MLRHRESFEVMIFFQGYVFEEDEMKKIEDLWLHGNMLPTLIRGSEGMGHPSGYWRTWLLEFSNKSVYNLVSNTHLF